MAGNSHLSQSRFERSIQLSNKLHTVNHVQRASEEMQDLAADNGQAAVEDFKKVANRCGGRAGFFRRTQDFAPGPRGSKRRVDLSP